MHISNYSVQFLVYLTRVVEHRHHQVFETVLEFLHADTRFQVLNQLFDFLVQFYYRGTRDSVPAQNRLFFSHSGEGLEELQKGHLRNAVGVEFIDLGLK